MEQEIWKCKYKYYAPVIEEPVVHAGGVEEVEAGQPSHHVTRDEVPEANHTALAPILLLIWALARPENSTSFSFLPYVHNMSGATFYQPIRLAQFEL